MRFGFLLRPGWLALTAAVFVFAVASFTLLAPWQFDRHTERSQQNEAVQEAMQARPQPLDQALPNGAAPTEESQWTPVTITGTFSPDDEVVARLRSINGEPAYEVLTPLRTASGETVLIDRGYVKPDERSQVPDYPPAPSGPVTVVARAQIDERTAPERSVDQQPGTKPQVYGVSSKGVERSTALELRDGYFTLAAGQPGVLQPLPLPRTQMGPFLAYAWQWIAFGVMAILGWAYFTIREARPGGVLYAERKRSVAQILADDEAAEQAADRRESQTQRTP